jgi:serine/threonine-protein kinase
MDTLGRYKILDEIGRGAMGVVYRAQDPSIGRTVAMKTIRLSEVADASELAKLRDRLFREAQSAGALSHPGIVTIYDVGEEDGVAYVAMEYVDGPTLDRMLVSDPPDAKLVLAILSQTAAALDYAHKRGIIHRDIKPANIMVHERTTAKITDFGVAKIQSHQMTHAGSMVGTPNYMSPEQIQAKPVTGRSDQFSLGVIAYELLTGEKPFVADSMPSLVFKVVKEDPVPVHRLNSTLGWAVDTVVKRALSKDPEERYPTCSDFAFALENACRTSKGWQPIAPGALQDTPTVGPAAAAAVAIPPAVETPVADAAAAAEADEPDRAPRWLRVARALAVAVLCIALALAGFDYFYPGADPDEGTVAGEADEAAPSPLQERAVIDPRRAGEGTLPAAEEPPAPPPAASEPKSAAAAAGPGEVRLVTNPPGAELVIDGRSDLSCTSPCTLTLPPGRHTLASSREGYRRTLKIFDIPQENEIFLNLDRTTGTLAIRTDPPGAAIYINGRLRSELTPAVLALPTGVYTVELVKDGARQSHQVVVRDSVITNVAVNFEAR